MKVHLKIWKHFLYCFNGNVINTLPEIASEFLFISLRCELFYSGVNTTHENERVKVLSEACLDWSYYMPVFITLKTGVKSKSEIEIFSLTFNLEKKSELSM